MYRASNVQYEHSDRVRGLARDLFADMDQRRQDEVYLDALGTQRIPDPTTAGGFLPPL